MIDDHIEYYLNITKKLKTSLIHEQSKLLSYEHLVMNERMAIREKSFLSRLFSGHSKFIRDLNKLIRDCKRDINNLNYQIEKNIKDVSLVGTKELFENSEEVFQEKLRIKECAKVISNLEYLKGILTTTHAASKQGLTDLRHGRSTASEQHIDKAFEGFLSVIQSIVDVKKYVTLEEFIMLTEDKESSFVKNIISIINSIIECNKVLNTQNTEKLTFSSSTSRKRILEDNSELIDRIIQNTGLLLNIHKQKLEEVITIKTHSLERLEKLKNDCKVVFINKLEKGVSMLSLESQPIERQLLE